MKIAGDGGLKIGWEIMMRRVIEAVWLACLLAGPALAQTYEEPPPKAMTEESLATSWLIAAAFLAGCLVVAFKPAKRANLK